MYTVQHTETGVKYLLRVRCLFANLLSVPESTHSNNPPHMHESFASGTC